MSRLEGQIVVSNCEWTIACRTVSVSGVRSCSDARYLIKHKSSHRYRSSMRF